MSGNRRTRKPLTGLVAALVIVVAVASFFIGRATAPTPTTASPCPANVALTGVALPDGYTASGGGYFSLCEFREAERTHALGKSTPPLKVYADPTGKTVIAWWYSDCGLPEGVVHAKGARPACVTTGTTGTAPTNS